MCLCLGFIQDSQEDNKMTTSMNATMTVTIQPSTTHEQESEDPLLTSSTHPKTEAQSTDRQRSISLHMTAPTSSQQQPPIELTIITANGTINETQKVHNANLFC